MTCKTCNGPLIGDGYTVARHCENVDVFDVEPDAGPVFCRDLVADIRRALRAYDLAGPLTETRRAALGEILTLARQMTEE